MLYERILSEASGVQSKSHKDTADDIKLVTENGRPSMYVYHTIVMVRTLSSCWQVVTSFPAPPPGQLPLGWQGLTSWFNDFTRMFHYHYRFIQSVSGPSHVQTRTAGQHWQSGSMLVEQGVGCSWHCCKYGNCWVLEFCYSVMVCLMYWYNHC